MKKLNPITLMIVTILSVVSFYQCTNDEEIFQGFPTESDFTNLQEVHDTMTLSDTLVLTLTDPTIENILDGQDIRLVFPPNSCTLNGGGAATAPYTIKLIEIFTRGDMIKHNIHTFAGEDPLVSGGMFWLEVTDATGAELTMNGVQAILPYQTDATGYENSMQYFIGTTVNAPSGPVISWGTGNSDLSWDETAGTNGEFTIWNIVGGWSNCDAFYDLLSGDVTQFSVRVPNAPDFANTQVFFALNDFTTVAALTTVMGDALTTYTGSIPTGAQGKIIAISLVEGSLQIGSQDVTIAGDDSFDLVVAPATIQDLQTLLATMD